MLFESLDNNSAAPYLASGNTRGYLECIVTLTLWLLSLFVAYYLSQERFWVSFLIIPLLSLIFVRLFVLMHDCAHYSLFKDRNVNVIVGRVFSAITFTPFFGWRWQHMIHHRTTGDLNERAVGGVV